MTNNDEIVRIADEEEYGLVHRHIFGLNLFSYNDVPCPTELRPDVIFLNAVVARMTCSAQVGALFLSDCVDSPEEIFGPVDDPKTSMPYCMADQVGISDGFYDLQGGILFGRRVIDGRWVIGEPRYGDCFLPRVTPELWDVFQSHGTDPQQLIENHALAIYVNPKQH